MRSLLSASTTDWPCMGWIAALTGRWGQARNEEVSSRDLRQLQRRLGYRFRRSQLLIHALKHRSYVYAQQGHGIDSNERLEYLGDAVLDLVVAEFLFREFDDQREGHLTQMKSLIVSRGTLADKARRLGLGRFVLLSFEERSAGGHEQPSILCDTFEAIVGAMYLDGGLQVVIGFAERWVLDDYEDLINHEDYVNFKSKLLERTQREGTGYPKYFVRAEEGPDHDKVFSVEVSITSEKLGWGRGRSKKEAQQMAARDALQRLEAL